MTTHLHENKIFTNHDKSKQFRIVRRNKGNTHDYVSKRVFRYVTNMGTNSAGGEKVYERFRDALKAERKWLEEI